MRLTCPNCAAEYEVDAALIPDEGRDVQCSNCGKTWFELPPTAEAEPPTPVIAAPVADSLANDAGDEADQSEWDEPQSSQPQEETAPAPEPPAEPQGAPEARQISEPVTPAAPKRREVDPRALDILKEEADRELATRRKEREGVEVQSEFDLTERSGGAEPSRALRARMARLRGESDPRPQSQPPQVSQQSQRMGYARPERELLPDIEEINSSLRPPDAEAEAAADARRADFRRGFGMMLGLAAFLVAIYIAAPAIARTLPGLQPMMVAYLDAANGFRDFVDGVLR